MFDWAFLLSIVKIFGKFQENLSCLENNLSQCLWTLMAAKWFNGEAYILQKHFSQKLVLEKIKVKMVIDWAKVRLANWLSENIRFPQEG